VQILGQGLREVRLRLVGGRRAVTIINRRGKRGEAVGRAGRIVAGGGKRQLSRGRGVGVVCARIGGTRGRRRWSRRGLGLGLRGCLVLVPLVLLCGRPLLLVLLREVLVLVLLVLLHGCLGVSLYGGLRQALLRGVLRVVRGFAPVPVPVLNVDGRIGNSVSGVHRRRRANMR
jgi:hypothetical protein